MLHIVKQYALNFLLQNCRQRKPYFFKLLPSDLTDLHYTLHEAFVALPDQKLSKEMWWFKKRWKNKTTNSCTLCSKQIVLHIFTKYSPINTTLSLNVFHGWMSVCAKFGANQPIGGAFMAKWQKKPSWNMFTFEWKGFLQQRAVLPC